MVRSEMKMIAVAFLTPKHYKQACYKKRQMIIQIEKLHKK